MDELDTTDRQTLDAVSGWVDLGNTVEARLELDRLPSGLREHPEVLHAEWQILSAEQKWEPALQVARKLIEVAPDEPLGWISRSFSLHELKRTEEAYTGLVEGVDRFPDISTIPYNLACYSCQMGRTTECWAWLNRAIRIRGKEEIKAQALSDDDLRPLWKELRAL